MEENAASAVIVTDGAAAADGGSPWIRISVDAEARHYSLVRVLASCTACCRTKNGGMAGWRVPLERIADPAMCAGIVGTFIQVLKRPDAS
ncbi:hypothetical protein WT97_07035 [Burkholderia sp. MSMB1459WGS]|uniref:hypothetical protein n=1 Tax=Burkholderia sp. MSMB1459WGS TaxID=1637970 RepID=UPI0007600E19|nr:hypothetical protein [Burkholderia sp. MSMB1459WGS]KWO47822.1 hypothetical protein WT97_07035 [Burkholderia sp. MSMB1459WGS]